MESGHAAVLAALAAAPGKAAGYALVDAAERKDLAAVQLLLRAGVKPAGTGAIAAAAWEQSLEVVEALLSGGSPVDDVTEGDSATALMAAASNDDIPLMLVLLAAGANPQTQWEGGALAACTAAASSITAGPSQACALLPLDK